LWFKNEFLDKKRHDDSFIVLETFGKIIKGQDVPWPIYVFLLAVGNQSPTGYKIKY